MAINYELLNSGAMTVGGGFNLYSKNPLDSRLVIPAFDGLQTLIDNGAAYEGMIVYISSEKKHYEVKTIDGVLSYRQFGLTTDELNELITNATTAAMEFKGATATLPENPGKGDMWKVTASFNVGDEEVKLGDSIVYNGEQWFVIPSGDDIEDTWRPVDGVGNDATLKFVDGAKTVAVVASNGEIKYNHEAIEAPELLAANEQTRTYITAVETDGYGHITGYKTATENVVDKDTTYEFECATEHSNVYFTVKEKLNGEEVAEHTVCVDAYNKNEADSKFAKKEYFDYSADNGAVIKTSDVSLTRLGHDELLASGDSGMYTIGVSGPQGQASLQLGSFGITHVWDPYSVEDTVIKHVAFTEDLGALADKSEVSKTDLDQDLANELDAKIAFVEADDESITIGGSATEPTIAVKISAAEGNALTLADDGLKVIIPESTKVEASETNGNIKVDGVEVTVYEHPEKHTVDEITDFAVEVAKVKVNEAIKATQDGSGNIIADTYTKKEHFDYSDATASIKTGDYSSVYLKDGEFRSSGDSDEYTIYHGGPYGQMSLTLASGHGTDDGGLRFHHEYGQINVTKNVAFTEDLGTLASKDTVEETDLAETLATKINDKLDANSWETADGRLRYYANNEEIIYGKRAIIYVNDATHQDIVLNFPELGKEGTIALTSDIAAAVDAIDLGVTQIVAGNDIEVTPAEGTGVVTIAHQTFTTGEYTKDPASSDKDGDVYMMTSVSVDNGHVTGASVKSLADALMGMSFIFDGGTSTN